MKKSFLDKNIRLNVWQTGIFKVATISFGILLGIYYTDLLTQYANLLWFVFILTAAMTLYFWWQQQ